MTDKKPTLIQISDSSTGINLRESFMGGEVLRTVMEHEARPKEAMLEEVADIISSTGYKLEDGQTPMAVVEGTQQSEVNMLLNSMKRLNLVAIDDILDREISEHLSDLREGRGTEHAAKVIQFKPRP